MQTYAARLFRPPVNVATSATGCAWPLVVGTSFRHSARLWAGGVKGSLDPTWPRNEYTHARPLARVMDQALITHPAQARGRV